MLKPRFYPRGNALTEPAPFTDVDGADWLVYIEGVPVTPHAGWRTCTRLPQRRLRFDSLLNSRATSAVPPGAPFLRAEQVQSLLERAHSVERCLRWSRRLGAAALPSLIPIRTNPNRPS